MKLYIPGDLKITDKKNIGKIDIVHSNSSSYTLTKGRGPLYPKEY